MGCCRADLRAFQDMGIVLENSMSAAQFELVVQRKAAYFYNNFVLTVCLLTAVSWLTFRMDPVSATTMPTSGQRCSPCRHLIKESPVNTKLCGRVMLV